jgi:hypothetical protein
MNAALDYSQTVVLAQVVTRNHPTLESGTCGRASHVAGDTWRFTVGHGQATRSYDVHRTEIDVEPPKRRVIFRTTPTGARTRCRHDA